MIEIDGTSYETKFNYRFYQRVVDNYSTKEQDGFTRLFGELVDANPDALVSGYRYAIDAKKLPSTEAVAEALADSGIYDAEDPFADMFKQIKANGFLVLKLKGLMNIEKSGLKRAQEMLSIIKKNKDATEEDIKGAQNQLQMVELQYKSLEKRLKDLNK